MRKLINTLKYSSPKAKLILILTILAGLAGASLVVASILTHMTVLFFGAVMCGFGALALAQTFVIHTSDPAGKVVPPGMGAIEPNLVMPERLEAENPEDLSDINPDEIPSENMEDVLNRLIAATDTGHHEDTEEPATAQSSEPRTARDFSRRKTELPEISRAHAEETIEHELIDVTEEEKTGKKKEKKEKKDKKRFSIGSFFKNAFSKILVVEQDDEDLQESAKDKKKKHKKLGRLRLNFGKHRKKREIEKEEVKEEPKQGDINIENWFRQMEGAPSVEEEYRNIHVKDTGVPLEELEAAEHAEIAEKLGQDAEAHTASDDEEEAPGNLVVVRQATEDDFKRYDRKTIKKTMHRYKVKRDHRLVMIDRCEKLAIKQTPAYVWVKDKDFNILLIEQEPRHIVLPVYRMKEMTYLKKQIVNEDVDYGPFKGKSMLAELFRPYLPDYSHSTVVDDLSSYKNLYGFGPDIYVTNRSAKQIFDLLALPFRVDDKVTLSAKVNNYFKDTYKANILLRDNVIDANGYADRIASILDGMAHSTISYNEFKETLNLMVKNKLITQEFAQYYMTVRDKADTRR